MEGWMKTAKIRLIKFEFGDQFNQLRDGYDKTFWNKVEAIKNLKDFQQYIDMTTLTGDNPFYGWSVSADMKNSVMNAVYLGGPKLGLGKDFYQKENNAIPGKFWEEY
ncbi:hypothetical protein FQR65_LT17335 [Abscondita terminalis]|nr:hypothetical protein FQR65_LT17335 [Abscondita terminalis]